MKCYSYVGMFTSLDLAKKNKEILDCFENEHNIVQKRNTYLCETCKKMFIIEDKQH